MAIILLFIIFIDSKLILRGSGFFPKPTVEQLLLFSYLIIIFSSSKKIFWLILFPFILIYASYTPVGLTFGGPTYQHIASLLATDSSEAKEFLAQISYKNYFYSIAILALLILYRFICVRYNLYLFKNKLVLCFFTIAILFNQVPFDFYKKTYSQVMNVKKELDVLDKLSVKSDWGNSTLENSKYDDYVLIIGESARRDYHHAYGYPIENTPFMSSSKGGFINGFESAGTYTIGSLKLMLTQPDTKKWSEKYSLNLVDLIKSAGIKTYWISNQGYLGKWDTPISSIGNKSDYKKFLEKGASNSRAEDLNLIPVLQDVLKDKEKNKRFIVLHLYGSHPNACDRISGKAKIFSDKEIDSKYKYLNCYITSIKETDKVLEKIYKTLDNNYKENNRKFSMIYFSDHGQCHFWKNASTLEFTQACHSKLHNDVPLFKISSDDTERQEYKVFKSGLNFTNGIANWIGIINPKLDKTIDLFSNKDDVTDYGLKDVINKRTRELDPAIDIRLNK